LESLSSPAAILCFENLQAVLFVAYIGRLQAPKERLAAVAAVVVHWFLSHSEEIVNVTM
jgi:hypothetical protein